MHRSLNSSQSASPQLSQSIGWRLPVVGVMGSGTLLHTEKSKQLGNWLATQKVHLLVGGGSGVMQAVAQAFAESVDRAGAVIGIIPGSIEQMGRYTTKHGYPNPWVDLPIYTHLPNTGAAGLELTSRNHINILSSTVIVILPGERGTSVEAELAIRYQKPVMAWADEQYQIPDLHPQVPKVQNFEQVKKFVTTNIA